MSFCGSDPQEDPQALIDEVSWICRGLDFSPTRMVELVAFHFRVVVKGGYEIMLLARLAGAPLLLWTNLFTFS